jgi:hypothetical protein
MKITFKCKPLYKKKERETLVKRFFKKKINTNFEKPNRSETCKKRKLKR